MSERLDRDAFFARVRALDLPAGTWAVHASGAMLARGLLDDAGDVDVVARGEGWRRAAARGTVERGDPDRKVALPGRVEVFDGWFGFDRDALIDEAVPVEGVPCVRLEAVLAFKRWKGRPKDRRHAALIEAHLARTAGDGPR